MLTLLAVRGTPGADGKIFLDNPDILSGLRSLIREPISERLHDRQSATTLGHIVGVSGDARHHGGDGDQDDRTAIDKTRHETDGLVLEHEAELYERCIRIMCVLDDIRRDLSHRERKCITPLRIE